MIVDTVGIHPQTYIAISEAQGIPNNGDMHITERIYLAGFREGATLAYRLGLLYPERFAGIITHRVPIRALAEGFRLFLGGSTGKVVAVHEETA